MASQRSLFDEPMSFEDTCALLNKQRSRPVITVAGRSVRFPVTLAALNRMPNAAIPHDLICQIYCTSEPRDRIVPASPTSIDADIRQELGLIQGMTVDALVYARRKFAWHHHPDRVAVAAKPLALERMKAANDIIDGALKLARSAVASVRPTQSA